MYVCMILTSRLLLLPEKLLLSGGGLAAGGGYGIMVPPYHTLPYHNTGTGTYYYVPGTMYQVLYDAPSYHIL